MTPARRRAIESVAEELILEPLTLEQERDVQPLIRGLFRQVETIGAELDLRPDGSATLEVALETASPLEAQDLKRRLASLRRELAPLLAPLGVEIDAGALPDRPGAELDISVRDVRALAAFLKM
jgi:hypothetical protein